MRKARSSNAKIITRNWLRREIIRTGYLYGHKDISFWYSEISEHYSITCNLILIK